MNGKCPSNFEHDTKEETNQATKLLLGIYTKTLLHHTFADIVLLLFSELNLSQWLDLRVIFRVDSCS